MKAGMDFDSILKATGSFGKFQVKIVAVCYVAVMFSALPVQQDLFVAFTPLYRCSVPLCDEEGSSYKAPYLNFTIPYDEKNQNWDTCHYYEHLSQNISARRKAVVGGTLDVASKGEKWNEDPGGREPSQTAMGESRGEVVREERQQLKEVCEPLSFSDVSTRQCDSGYIYDTSVFSSSAVIDFSLTCDRVFLAPLLGSAYMLGSLVSSILMGFLGDHFGRKVTFLVSVLVMVCGGLVCALAKSYYLLLAMRFLTAVGGNGIFQCAFIITVENVIPSHRVAVGIMINAPYALGGAWVALMAYLVRDNWRVLQLLYTAPALMLLAVYWLVPKSVRWLASRGRLDEATQVVQLIASTNGSPIPHHLLPAPVNKDGSVSGNKSTTGCESLEEEEEDTESKSKSFIDILRLPNMRERSLIKFFIWPSVTLVYYGVSLNSVNLGGNIFLNFLMSMLIEIPAYFFAWFALDRLGRKGTLVLTLLLSGIPCFVSGFLPEDWSTVVVSLSLIGKFGAAAAFSIIYVYASEVFPTEYRSVGVGACSMTARVGGILAPIIAGVGRVYYRPLPLLLFGVITIVSGLLTLLLPETAGCTLPNTLQESELFGSEQAVTYFLCLDKGRQAPLAASDASCQATDITHTPAVGGEQTDGSSDNKK